VRGSLQVQLAERIERELGRVALANPAEHWFAIGGACSVLERSGRVELVPDVRLPAHLGIGVPAEYLWATCWHEADDTRRVALGAVWEDYRARSGLRLGADARAMALVGGVRSGLLTPAQVVEDEGRWGELVNARQDILAAVWRLGDDTPELARWLARLEDGLRQRLAAAGMGVFDGHRELLQRLGVARPAPELSQDGAKLLM
jgi:hypothetical protein